MNATQSSEFYRLSQLAHDPSKSVPAASEDALHPAPHPASQPADSTKPIDTTPSSSLKNEINPTPFQACFSQLKSVVGTLDETSDPAQILQTLVQLFEPILKLVPDSAFPGLDPETDLLEQELQLANDPKSRLDQLSEDRQEKLFELLQNEKGAACKLPPLLLKHWDLQTSETALRQFKKRHQAKLEAAEKARLQKELDDLASPHAPNHTQAAEKLLERRLIQTVLDPKSTPEEIQKIVSATTRFINCQTSRARLEFQKQKSSSEANDTPNEPPTKSSSGGNDTLTESKETAPHVVISR